MFDCDPYVNRLQVGQLANVKGTTAAVDLETPQIGVVLAGAETACSAQGRKAKSENGYSVTIADPNCHFILERDDKTI